MTSKVKKKWNATTVARSIRILSRSDQRKILLVISIQIFLSLFDLLAIAAVGVLGALAVNGVQSKAPGNRVGQVLELFHLEDFSFQSQVATIGFIAASIMICRTILSVYFGRKTLFFLSRRSAAISSELISKLLTKPLNIIQKNTTQETIYALTSGVNAITVGVIGTVVSIVSDVSILFVMSIGLIAVDTLTAVVIFTLFGVVAYILYYLMHKKISFLGYENSRLSIDGSEKIVQVLSAYREAIVGNRRDYYAKEIGNSRLSLANVNAETAFLPNVSKYVIEVTIVLAALIVSALQFTFNNAAHAVAALAVFMTAGSRIAPAILRMQQGLLHIKGSLGAANPTLELIESLSDSENPIISNKFLVYEHKGFKPNLSMENITLSYAGKNQKALDRINLRISENQSVAIVGPSGAGKTSLVDVMLGVLKPDIGSVQISGLEPLQAIARWPGAIAYVPQDILMFSGSVAENVALGFPKKDINLELVSQAISAAQLDDFVLSLPNGLNTQVGERGAMISGGQRQRLGIARALYTKPNLLVLDEATSALDSDTELQISKSINDIKRNATVVMIAHRLSTALNADLVVYMDSGHILAVGNFQQVREQISDFDHQAKLMGL